MIESQSERIARWMEIAGQTVRVLPTGKIPEDEWRLRRNLMREELRELEQAMLDNDIVAIADGVADLMYVVIGTAVAYGIDIDPIFDIVHDNNMTKFLKCEHSYEPERRTCPQCHGRGIRALHRDDGKVLKQPGWIPPTQAVMDELVHQGYTGEWTRHRYDHFPPNKNNERTA